MITTNSDAKTTLRRAAEVRASSYNPERRTVEAGISTGAGVRRRDARGSYIERLDLRAIRPVDVVDLPVLNAHRQGDLRDVIGVVKSARFDEGGVLVAVIRLSVRADVEELVEDIKSGVIRGVSIGYEVARFADGTDPSSGERTRTATQWVIKEISFVPVPADPGATIRSEPPMPEIINPPPLETPMPAPVPDDVRRIRAEVRTIARSAGLTADWADAQIDAGADVTAARAAAFTEMQTRSATPIRTQLGVDHTDPAAILKRRQEALFARVNGTAPPDEARAFMGDRLVDHARGLLASRGVSTTGLQPEEILTRAAQHTLSDFPNLLTGVGNRMLLASYEAAPNPLKALARRTTRPDFRPGSTLRLGEVGRLQPVSESGEIKSVTRGESIESYALDTYASIFSLSRKAGLNDDLGGLRDWSLAAGKAAAETEAQLLVTLLTQSSGLGPIMGDGKRLFHADHGNLGSALAVGTTGLSAARLAMRTQKGVDGVTPINATPKFVLVPPNIETATEMVLATLSPAEVDNVNVFSGKLTPLVEPRLTNATAWYLFADPAVLPVFELAYLSSAPGPQMSSREGWDVLGVEFRVVLDFGAGAIDWRGAFRNPGA